MRHNNGNRKLGRRTSHRVAMFRNLVTSLFEHERITTTHEKAKEIRPIAEKLITLAKRNDLHARRQALACVRSKAVTDKLFTVLKDRFQTRPGGYTRIILTGVRRGDAAKLALIELVDYQETVASSPSAE